MKLTSPMIVGISIAVLLLLAQAYIDVEWFGTSRDLARLEASSAEATAQISSIQGSVNSFKESLKQYDTLIGPNGTIQLLAKGLAEGDADLSVKSLRIVINGRPVVSLASAPDAGGLIQVVSNDGTGSAEIFSAPGKSRIAFKATTGADAAQVVHLATYGGDGLYLQKGATDDMAARTDGAGLQIQDAGADFFMAQSGGGSVSMDTSTAEERAKLSLSLVGSPKRIVSLSVGGKDASPFISAAGSASGYTMTLLPDRLTLANKSGAVAMTAAGDDNGGFVIANDNAGERRAIMASGTDGHGTMAVFGNDGRSNTLYPEFNIQRTGSTQK